jgi:phosphate/sulfate permease
MSLLIFVSSNELNCLFISLLILALSWIVSPLLAGLTAVIIYLAIDHAVLRKVIIELIKNGHSMLMFLEKSIECWTKDITDSLFCLHFLQCVCSYL